MSGKCFVDSNIWLYAFFTTDHSDKHNKAIEIIDRDNIVLSTQVINEVCCNLLRKAKYTESEIQQTIQNFQVRYPILNVNADIIRQASVLRGLYCFSYWDSIITATAISADCAFIYSEDMQHGQKIDPVTVVNPFKS
jgi:predicted nucleic acid-binding protein